MGRCRAAARAGAIADGGRGSDAFTNFQDGGAALAGVRDQDCFCCWAAACWRRRVSSLTLPLAAARVIWILLVTLVGGRVDGGQLIGLEKLAFFTHISHSRARTREAERRRFLFRLFA